MTPFKLNETYTTRDGSSCRIICIDSPMLKPIIGILKADGGYSIQQFRGDGRWNQSGLDNTWDLISDDPDEEETLLIGEIQSMLEKEGASSEQLLKVIRRLRRNK